MKQTRAGFTLTEIVIGALLAGVVILLIARWLPIRQKMSADLRRRVELEEARNLIRTSLDCVRTLSLAGPWTAGSVVALHGKTAVLIATPSRLLPGGEYRAVMSPIPKIFDVQYRPSATAPWSDLFAVPLACS